MGKLPVLKAREVAGIYERLAFVEVWITDSQGSATLASLSVMCDL
jgi:hypothetical protein